MSEPDYHITKKGTLSNGMTYENREYIKTPVVSEEEAEAGKLIEKLEAMNKRLRLHLPPDHPHLKNVGVIDALSGIIRGLERDIQIHRELTKERKQNE